MNKQIIEYFQARNKSDAAGWPVLLVLPLLIILVPFGFLAAAVMWLYDAIRGLIKKDATISNEEVPYIVLHQQGVKLVVGYEGGSNEAAGIAREIQKKYGEAARLYDWTDAKGLDLSTVSSMPSPEKEYVSVLMGDTCCSAVLSPIVEAESPITVYAIAIYEAADEFLTAYPLLDNWTEPTKVLGKDDFYKEIDTFITTGIVE